MSTLPVSGCYSHFLDVILSEIIYDQQKNSICYDRSMDWSLLALVEYGQAAYATQRIGKVGYFPLRAKQSALEIRPFFLAASDN